MSLNCKVLDLEGIIALPIKVKEQFPVESVKWDMLTRGCIDIWLDNGHEEITYRGKRYEVKEIK